ncbi:MAG TPA: hypothetical protein VL945_01680 [Candidatus Saccharimonadales bacterium]|nr:hypothetical protein [Candidatus Saccharimonadales bacterium]
MNKKTIAAFVIILVLLLVFAYYVILHTAKKTPPPIIVKNNPNTTANTTTNTITNTTITNSSTTNSTTNSTRLDCISSAQTVAIDNGNFATGTYAGWNLTGLGFLNASLAALPTNIIYANANLQYYGSPWANYDGEYFATTYHGGINLSPGNLTSDAFEVEEPYLNFRISSPASSLLYVELLQNGKPVRINYYNTLNANGGNNPQSTFVNGTMPLLNYVCQNVSVRVVAGVVGASHDFIAVGDFVQSKSNIQTPGTLINSTNLGSTS